MGTNDLLAEYGFNLTDLYPNLIPQEILNQINFILYLGRIILIFSIIYIIVLILLKIFRLFFGSKETRILKDINRKLEEIVDILRVKKFDKEHGKKEKSEKHLLNRKL